MCDLLKERKELEKRSKSELIELLLQSKRNEKNYNNSKQLDWTKYSIHHIAFKFYYLGWDMHGLAQQPDRLNTIEEHFFRALRTAKLIPPNSPDNKYGLPSECNFQRCGRTDVGVSAFSQVFSLNIRSLKPKSDTSNISVISYIHKLNSLLPEDIKIYAAAEVPDTFSARYSCIGREYKYFFIQEDLDIDILYKASQLLVGEHDFRNFCKIDAANVISFVRKIYSISIEKIYECNESKRNIFAFVISGSGFLWHQVRCITSILFLIGQRKEDINIIKELLDIKKHPCKPIYTMANEIPLVLWDCIYPDSIKFIYDSNVLQKLSSLLYDQWKGFTIKTSIIQHILDTIQSKEEYNQILPKKRKYKEILALPVGPSLDELISNLSSKRKEQYNKKKQKLEEYEQSKK